MARRSIFISGRFLTQPTTGVQRVAREIVAQLDAMVGRGAIDGARHELVLLTPPRVTERLALEHVSQRPVGKRSGHRWEQTDLARAARGGTLLSPGNTGPLRHRRQVVLIHDASVFAVPDAYTRAFRLWYRFALRRLARVCPVVVTPSAFSAREVVRWCGVERSRVVVAHLGAEHVLRVEADPSLLRSHGLIERPYVLAVGSRAPHKNLDRVLAAGAALRDRGLDLVVVGGAAPRVFGDHAVEDGDAVRHLGYCSDAQLRALYEHATCLVFPSLYEGFGLPPLEAMACGCPVLVSRAASLPEVCDDAAEYCDPVDGADVTRRLLDLVDDAPRRVRLAERGRARATAFSWAGTAATIWSALAAVDSAAREQDGPG